MDVYIIGKGGNSKIVAEICNLIDYRIIGYFDDSFVPGSVDLQERAFGTVDDIFEYGHINVINSIGDCTARQRIHEKISNGKITWPNCIHPYAYISPSAKLGQGNVICNSAIVNTDAVIGDFNLVNTGAIIEHDCIVESFNHFGPKSALCGQVHVGNGNLFGVGSSVIPCIHIGNRNRIGAMAALIGDVENDSTMVGVPAKKL